MTVNRVRLSSNFEFFTSWMRRLSGEIKAALFWCFNTCSTVMSIVNSNVIDLFAANNLIGKNKDPTGTNACSINKSTSPSTHFGSNNLPRNAGQREEAPQQEMDFMGKPKSIPPSIHDTVTLKDSVDIPVAVPNGDLPQIVGPSGEVTDVMLPIRTSQRPLQTIYIDILRLDK